VGTKFDIYVCIIIYHEKFNLSSAKQEMLLTLPEYLISLAFLRYAQSRKHGKPNNVKGLGSNKTKGPKPGSQILLRSPMAEGI
jgi:hypothetical protein